MGVYTWIRENVKRAVLMGFNDAIEVIGPPTEEKPMNEHLAAVLGKSPALAAPISSGAAAAALTASEIADSSTASSAMSGTALDASGMGARPRRKRLGRSLEQIQQGAPKAA